MDVTVKSMNTRLAKKYRFMQGFGRSCMKNLSAKSIKYNPSATPENLEEEIINFVKNWDGFKLTIADADTHKYKSDIGQLDNDEEKTHSRSVKIVRYAAMI
ncbi:hypothetical protein JTB14_003382 [Gonioctena quinquepunctata]|nr:hypothetical protein JTB14_003382 [Gonioctena quinquepunctata]